jgi:YHS domain-containing protein
MTVDPEQARDKGLAFTYEDREYIFCGKGCLLEFRDDPETYLKAGHVASMGSPSWPYWRWAARCAAATPPEKRSTGRSR